MAKKNDEKLNYQSVLRKLKERGPQQLYLLWGPEDYLREHFLTQIKSLCLPDGDDSFSYKRLNGPELDAVELQQAVDAIPFLSDRTLVELRGVDLNRLKDTDAILKTLADIPDYCTVVFVQGADFEPDGRLKQIKKLRAIAEEIEFTQQQQNELTKWIAKRFAALGKSIEFDASQRLIFISGDLMNRLIPEIDKIAAYAKGERVTVADVEAVAHHIPEAVIFTMTRDSGGSEVDNYSDLVDLFKNCSYDDFDTIYKIVRKLKLLQLDLQCVYSSDDFNINRTNLFQVSDEEMKKFNKIDRILEGSTLYELF